MLLTCCHVLEGELVLGNLVVASEHNEGNGLGVGVAHLLLHLCLVGEHFCADACGTAGTHNRKTIGRLLVAKVDEQQLGAVDSLLGIEVKTVEHVVDAVSTKRDAYAAQARHAEDSCEVVITSATRNAANGIVESFNLEDGTGIIVETAGESEVELNLVVERALATCSLIRRQL